MVLITVDTLRADVLTCYGYGNDTSPHLSRLAKEGVRFENVTAASPWTTPSVASITTGKYPDEVGVRDLRHGLPRSVTTLAERLQRAGYATGAVVSNTLAGPDYGHDQGYDFMHCLRYKDDEGVPSFTADRVTDQALQWMRSAEAPYFLYVHYTDPHDPYLPPGEFPGGAVERKILLENSFSASMKDAVKACYEAEVAFMDREVGRLLDAIARDTLVVFTGDHGEEFQEHGGYLHGHTLFQELLSVPLLFRGPGVPQGVVIHAPVSHVDITPTLLDRAGIALPDDLSGESLVPFFRNVVRKPRPRILFSVLENENTRRVAARQGPWKLEVRTDRAPERFSAALYHLDEDPGEEHNVAAENPELISSLVETMRARRTRLMKPEEHLDDETKKRREEELRALGYIK
jgi:arylsulfatase A-like enzyme